MPGGVGVVVVGMCLLAVLNGRLSRRETGLVGVLNEVVAAVEHKFCPPVVKCWSVVTWNALGSSVYATATRPTTFPGMQVLSSDLVSTSRSHGGLKNFTDAILTL